MRWFANGRLFLASSILLLSLFRSSTSQKKLNFFRNFGMWTKIKIKAVCLSLACILSLLIIQRTQGTGYCDLPFITFVYRELNQPEEIVNKVVSQLGGLPKTDMDIDQAMKQKDADVALAVYPVEIWQIANQRVTYDPGVKALLDDDPVYHHEFAIRVTYLDGDMATLQWSSWSYGVVACPVVVSLGIGPSGQFKIMPSSYVSHTITLLHRQGDKNIRARL